MFRHSHVCVSLPLFHFVPPPLLLLCPSFKLIPERTRKRPSLSMGRDFCMDPYTIYTSLLYEVSLWIGFLISGLNISFPPGAPSFLPSCLLFYWVGSWGHIVERVEKIRGSGGQAVWVLRKKNIILLNKCKSFCCGYRWIWAVTPCTLSRYMRCGAFFSTFSCSTDSIYGRENKIEAANISTGISVRVHFQMRRFCSLVATGSITVSIKH